MSVRFRDDGTLEKKHLGTWYVQFCRFHQESGFTECSIQCPACNEGQFTPRGGGTTFPVAIVSCTPQPTIMELEQIIVRPNLNPSEN